jgi:hypothetical protein
MSEYYPYAYAGDLKTLQSSVVITQPVNQNGNVIGRSTIEVTGSFSRPSYATTTYAAGDVVSNSTSSVITNELNNVVRTSGGSGTVLNAILIDGANQPLIGNYEVYVFKTNRTTEIDNSPFSCSYLDATNIVAVIPFSSSYFVVNGESSGNVVYLANIIPQSFVCNPTSSSLYWNLVVRNNYVPVASEQYTLKLNILQD